MNKELLISLIEKDLKELRLMTQGFSETDTYSNTLLELAASKAHQIADNVMLLPLCSSPLPSASVITDSVFINSTEEIISTTSTPTLTEDTINDTLIISEAQSDIKIEDDLLPLEDLSSFEKEDILETLMEEPAKDQSSEPIEIEIKTTIEAEPLEEVHSETTPLLENTPAQKTKNNPSPTVLEFNKQNKSVLDTLAANPSLASSMSQKEIADLRHGISIVDRFRFQRELFQGNGEKLNQALADFNNMNSIDEAIHYITTKFRWDLENDHVRDFLELLARKLH